MSAVVRPLCQDEYMDQKSKDDAAVWAALDDAANAYEAYLSRLDDSAQVAVARDSGDSSEFYAPAPDPMVLTLR